jgi:hypothetical protein
MIKAFAATGFDNLLPSLESSDLSRRQYSLNRCCNTTTLTAASLPTVPNGRAGKQVDKY